MACEGPSDPSVDYFCSIVNDINDKAAKQGRADISCAQEFQTKIAARHGDEVRSDCGDDARDCAIKKAATASKVLLTSAVFGRGTDFFCKDTALCNAGGMHVILTFIPCDKIEEREDWNRRARRSKSAKIEEREEPMSEQYRLEQKETKKAWRRELRRSCRPVRQPRMQPHTKRMHHHGYQRHR